MEVRKIRWDEQVLDSFSFVKKLGEFYWAWVSGSRGIEPYAAGLSENFAYALKGGKAGRLLRSRPVEQDLIAHNQMVQKEKGLD